METGFLSAVHDEEHFSSCFYSQGQGLDDSEGSLFGGMIVPDLDYDSGRFDPLPLWDSVGDIPGIIIPEKHMPSSPQCKEDFHKMFKDWQEHLTYMQVPESLKADDTLNISTRLAGDIFTPASNSLPTPSIDELFPLEIKQEEASVPEDETDRMQIEPVFSSDNKQVRNSEEEAEELARHVKKEIKLEIEEDCFDVEIDGEESVVKEGEIKLETEDDCVDIETIGDQMPVLEAGDLKSLLEQFEASEAVNGLDENKKKSILDAHLYNMVNQPASAPLSPPPASSVPTNQIIRDSLPKEVIDRIKASGRKKTISLIPAIPNKKSVRSATRMQDAAAALSRNKLLKLVTGGSSGESVQLDHDYCTSSDSMCTSVASSVYHSDNTDYPNTPEPTYSRLPDYYVALAPQKALEPRLNNDKWVEKNSKKDSGLESGDVSDASEETQTTPTEIKQKVVLKSVQGVKSVQVVTESGVVIGSAAVKQERKEMPMVSVLKKCNNISNNSNSGSNSVINSVSMSVESNVVSVSAVTSSVTSVISPSVTTVSSSTSICNSTSPPAMDVEKPAAEEPIKKKKLNLEEYRVRREERERIRSQENSRANSPVSCLTPTQPDSTSQVEGIKTEKPAMQSVEVQTVDFPEEELKKKDMKSRKERDQSKERRNDVRHRRYRARHVSSSSSSSSGGSSHHRSRRQRKHSRTGRSKSNNPASRMWSRSRSRSSSHASNCSSCSSHSRSRSRSRDSHWNGKWRSRSPRRTGRYNKHHHWRDNRRWQRRSPVRLNRPLPVVNQEWGVAEKMRQVEERRVIYVGRIEEGTTKAHLRERFQVFGPIVDISVHFRERGDNYGFVTFAYKVDAYEAVEHGNDDPSLPHYDLCFGGRRAFCKQRYADLDGVSSQQYNPYQGQRSNESFDLLLREAQAKLRKRSSV